MSRSTDFDPNTVDLVQQDTPEEPFADRDTAVTLLYSDMAQKLRQSGRLMDATCTKADKFRRLAKHNHQLITRLRSEVPKPPVGQGNGGR